MSFCVNARPHGGVYFRERGYEPTEQQAREAAAGQIVVSNRANRALMHYLGDPAPAPEDLEARYHPTNLLAAFTAVSKQAGWQVQKVAVDDSEFPFVVYGLLAGKPDLRAIEKALSESG